MTLQRDLDDQGAPLPQLTHDPVDWARLYWREQGYGPAGEDAFTVMCSVLRFHRLMTEGIEAELKKHKLNLTDYTVLMSLVLSKEQSISVLARGLMIHSTTATLVADRLENRGLITRRAHPTDRRATLISMSAAGRKLVDKATQALIDKEFGLQATSASDRLELVGVLARLRLAAGDHD